ncbi:MAG: SDR family NAD(P)-dependent oxidoreductase [Treponema sp.]|jgi:short-subunit dehydrogenase|nr:SDR family NAD(P)-dependent oxidoreductase [Treponema sp.]
MAKDKADSFAVKYGPWALVTGASRGLGAEFARQLAAKGLNLVLAARTESQLKELAQALEREYNISAKVIVIDLSREDLLDPIRKVTDSLDIGLLVNNAGLSTVGPFLNLSADFLLKQLHTNTRAALVLTKHFGEKMVAKGRGGIIFLSSGSALHGTQFTANYCATKAYNLMLAETLWVEWKPLGVDALGLIVGLTKTPGLEANKPKPNKFVPLGQPDGVVRNALKMLGKKPSTAEGIGNRFGHTIFNLMPRSLSASLLGKSMEAMFGPFDQNGKK